MWRQPLLSRGLGGVAATPACVIVGDRERNDAADAFRCFDAADGRELWTVRYLASGKLDYGNSPRATPFIDGDRAFLFGAMGDLTAVELATGQVCWQINVRDEFDVTAELPWGFCGSPLLVDGRIVVYAGGNEGALVALNADDGTAAWTAPGAPPGYGSLIAATLGGRRQLVGHDTHSLCGWDPTTGERLWQVVPARRGDFNVPTPVVAGERLLVTTEGNGTRLFRFGENGRIVAVPEAVAPQIAPDTHSPVAAGERLFIAHHDLYCLDHSRGLKILWKGTDEAFEHHTSLIASPERLLVLSHSGELLLVDAQADEYRLLGRQRLLADQADVLSHPALVGTRLYVRGNGELICVELEPP